jgi:predicted ATP-binding protein involved in virulence
MREDVWMNMDGSAQRVMALDRLTLKNFRCFAEMSIEFESDLTVLVARNGAGKTSVLDAAAIALGTVFVRIKGTDLPPPSFENADVRMSASSTGLTEESNFPVQIEASGFLDSVGSTWTRSKESIGGKTLFSNALAAVEFGQKFDWEGSGKQRVLPVICQYGTGRLHLEESVTNSKRRGSRLQAYERSLTGSSSYRQLCGWMLSLVTDGQEELSGFLNTIYIAIASMLQPMGVDKVDFSTYTRNFRARVNGVWLSADQLSDGTRNLLGLAADLSWRCVLLNESLGSNAVTQTPGVVLIDEVDMHLHPGWQQSVLTDLTRTFPLIQFIVTTHSPQVVSSVDRRHLRVLDGDRVVRPEIETSGATSDRILQAIFGVDERAATDRATAIASLRRLISVGDFSDDHTKAQAVAELASVREGTPTGDDPDVDLAEVELNWKLGSVSRP